MNKVNKVVIYTSSLCGFCYKAKSLLKRKNILFDEINIDINYEKKTQPRSNSKQFYEVHDILLIVLPHVATLKVF